MATIWNSNKKATNNNSFTGTVLSTWSRQQKLAMLAGFSILGILLVVSACSKQSAKPPLVSVSNPEPTPAAQNTLPTEASVTQPAKPAQPVAKKTAKKRAANVTYTDANSGVSFLYPRKFRLATGEKAEPELGGEAVPMDFVKLGGETIATVALPKSAYPGTDFSSALFTANVNRGLTQEECSRFAFVEMNDEAGELVAPESVTVGEIEMTKTDEFGGTAMKQAEVQYYHNYQNGACYEYILGLGTAGYGVTEGVEPVNRDEVFAGLEKILASVKIQPVSEEPVAQKGEATQEVAAAETASK